MMQDNYDYHIIRIQDDHDYVLNQVGLVVMPFSATYEGMEQAWVFGEVWCEVKMLMMVMMLMTIATFLWSLLGLALLGRFGLHSLNFASLCHLPR